MSWDDEDNELGRWRQCNLNFKCQMQEADYCIWFKTITVIDVMGCRGGWGVVCMKMEGWWQSDTSSWWAIAYARSHICTEITEYFWYLNLIITHDTFHYLDYKSINTSICLSVCVRLCVLEVLQDHSRDSLHFWCICSCHTLRLYLLYISWAWNIPRSPWLRCL